ncbi:sensor histidine kinase [Geobacter pickeringii]|uniref:histidine kinase n=1 Tax=Geobacter pickeringii TaxID=345632 RepID=A0A0B5BIY3_9BACT|nr:ATP-binding protein [Geobacter pickeringii]AJE04011.1 hypothetical protein GPICK_12175 [Geobacter pickeringii]
MKRPSVRIRLTLWYSAILACIILGFALGIYLFLQASLTHQIDGQLERDFATVARVVRDEPNEMNELAQHGSVALFQVTEGSDVVAGTDDWNRAGLEKAPPAPGSPSRSWSAPTGLRYRLKEGVVATIGHTYLVRVAGDGQAMAHALESLALILLIGIPGTLVAASAGGYFLASRALSPVAAMAAKAREITAERLSERLAVTNPDDEFGQLAAVFNETLARLEDSFGRMRRFTADASHELRTPLTALRSVGEVGMRDTADGAACREVIGSMLEEADRLTKLVDSLLTLSRADSGAAPLSRERTDLSALAAEVVDCLQVLAEENGQSLLLEGGEPLFAGVDRTTLRQSLMNLVDNAIRYTPGGGHIRVVTGRSAAGDITLEVADDGPGIPALHRERIFDRFYRIDTGRSPEAGGTGLGLAIARWGAEANGGRIELESEEGRGSTFRIVVPPAR